MQQERMKPQKPLGSILDLKMAKQRPLAGMTSPLEPPAVCTPPSGQAKLQNLQVSFALAYFMHVRGGALYVEEPCIATRKPCQSRHLRMSHIAYDGCFFRLNG